MGVARPQKIDRDRLLNTPNKGQIEVKHSWSHRSKSL